MENLKCQRKRTCVCTSVEKNDGALGSGLISMSEAVLHTCMITNLDVGLHALKVKTDGLLVEVPGHPR